MKLSDLVEKLTALASQHGDLEVFDSAHFSVHSVQVKVAAKDQFPEDWDMPEGYTFVQIDGS